MSRLLQLGVDPAKLYEQFRQREEQRREEQEGVQLRAQLRLTDHIVGGDNVSIRNYRLAREAERHLLVEPDIDLDSMTYHDYRLVREAEQIGKRPLSYNEFRTLLGAANNEPAPAPTPQRESTECDLAAYRAEREQEG